MHQLAADAHHFVERPGNRIHSEDPVKGRARVRGFPVGQRPSATAVQKYSAPRAKGNLGPSVICLYAGDHAVELFLQPIESLSLLAVDRGGSCWAACRAGPSAFSAWDRSVVAVATADLAFSSLARAPLALSSALLMSVVGSAIPTATAVRLMKFGAAGRCKSSFMLENQSLLNFSSAWSSVADNATAPRPGIPARNSQPEIEYFAKFTEAMASPAPAVRSRRPAAYQVPTIQ